MEDVKISFTVKHKSEVIKLNNLEEIKDHPILEVLKKNLLQFEKKMYSEAATVILNNKLDTESIKKIKVDLNN